MKDLTIKDVEKAYDKGVKDGRKHMLDELMDSFYKRLADDTKKEIEIYIEKMTLC